MPYLKRFRSAFRRRIRRRSRKSFPLAPDSLEQFPAWDILPAGAFALTRQFKFLNYLVGNVDDV